MSIQSPSIIDVSSDSGEEFVVQPSNLPDVEERIRVGGPRRGHDGSVCGRSFSNFVHIAT